MFRRFAVVAGVLLALAAGQAQAFDDGQRKDIETIVRSYLLDHPEVILEAIQTLRERDRADAEAEGRKAVAENKDAIFSDITSPVAGNPQGDVTMVEFFDYNCGYCKAMQKTVMDFVKTDGKIRFIYKEFPILAESSATTAKAALAARYQNRYVEMNNALMTFKGEFTADAIDKIARQVGLDTAKLKTDMERPEIATELAANKALAAKLGVSGTPAFVIGNELVPGALPKDRLAAIIADERRK